MELVKVLPRRFQPHTVQLIEQLPEDDDGMVAEQLITILRVEADPSYDMQQSKHGIMTNGKLVVYMKLGDYTAYDENDRVLRYGLDFFISTNDILDFRNGEYTVTGASEIFLSDARPIRAEITGK